MTEATQLDSEIGPIVRARVQDLLSHSEAYWGLSENQRKALARDMVKVAHFMVGGDDGHNVPRAATLSGARGPVQTLATADQLLNRTGAIAGKQGATTYTEMVKRVNFPSFVSGLIDGVFNSIVTSSIKQMEAYAKLVENVAKSVDQFMKENISENSARDYLANRYPDHLQVDTTAAKPVLKPKDGADDSDLPDFFKDLGLKQPVTSLDQDTTEQVLVPAARQRMAMDRQQLLATMVLMGINRLVVTDGHIQASCTFELNTLDAVTAHADQATSYDNTSTYTEQGATWYNPQSTYSYADTAKFNVSTHQSTDSTASVDLHAKLGGKVQVNFKSETFPLDKMADVLQINQIQEKAPAGMRAQVPGQPATPPPLPAPPPPLPATASPAAPGR